MVEIFTKSYFESVLPVHKITGKPLWQCEGLMDGEYCYFIKIDKEEKEKLGVKNGVKVVSVGDGPFKGKLQPGFVITKIDKQAVYTVQNVKSIIEAAEGAVLIEGKNSDGTDNVIGLKLGE